MLWEHPIFFKKRWPSERIKGCESSHVFGFSAAEILLTRLQFIRWNGANPAMTPMSAYNDGFTTCVDQSIRQTAVKAQCK
jgi:hypothetical protein